MQNIVVIYFLKKQIHWKNLMSKSKSNVLKYKVNFFSKKLKYPISNKIKQKDTILEQSNYFFPTPQRIQSCFTCKMPILFFLNNVCLGGWWDRPEPASNCDRHLDQPPPKAPEVRGVRAGRTRIRKTRQAQDERVRSPFHSVLYSVENRFSLAVVKKTKGFNFNKYV